MWALPTGTMMRSPPKSAVVRARWLAELAAALDEAHRLTLRLTEQGAETSEAILLRTQITAVRTAVEKLRRGQRSRPNKLDPIWTHIGSFMERTRLNLTVTPPGQLPRGVDGIKVPAEARRPRRTG